MKRLIMTALVGAGVAMASPAYAVAVVGPAATASPCTNFSFGAGVTEIACAGGYSGNLNKGSPLTGTGLLAIQALGYTGTGAYNETTNKIDTSGTTISFPAGLMTGLTIVGIHYGESKDPGGNATSFFEFDAGSGVSSITVTGRLMANDPALSNAVLYSTGGRRPLPEPATWAMMLVGFGGIGAAMRGRRKNALAQIA